MNDLLCMLELGPNIIIAWALLRGMVEGRCMEWSTHGWWLLMSIGPPSRNEEFAWPAQAIITRDADEDSALST
jgi:hypothetical protein